ncbi:hypothetical protein KKC88_01405 [Patescibacteria group bacterium]|nr:hypothetical protein [Patescibacteria group bacterium]MBU1673355.1 hypothetical protein [Patescibacteria group bacterium]MBU1963985.1 hypothetical protein [Patescibacteria group bacterium]
METSTSGEVPIKPKQEKEAGQQENRTEISQRDIIDGHVDLKAGDIVTTNGANEYAVESYDPQAAEVTLRFVTTDGGEGRKFKIKITDENIAKFERPE